LSSAFIANKAAAFSLLDVFSGALNDTSSSAQALFILFFVVVNFSFVVFLVLERPAKLIYFSKTF
jgi:hypothetical protein